MVPFSNQDEFKIVTNICRALKDSDIQMRDIMDNNKLKDYIKFTNCNVVSDTSFIQTQYTEFIDKIVVRLGQNINKNYNILNKIVNHY